MTYIKDFRERIANKNYPSFLQLWEEYCYSEEIDPEELREILEMIKVSSLATPFGNHVERALCLWRQIQTPEQADEILKLILDIQTTNTPEFANLALTHLTNKFGQDPTFQEKIRIVGLRSKDHFQSCIRNFELLNHMKKGKFVFHTSGWGTGEVTDISMLREEVSIEFDLVIDIKTLSFENAFKTLIPLPDTHFLSLRFGKPDQLEELAKKNHLEVMHMLLKDLGPKTAQEIKEELCDLVIPQDDWNRWWQTARSKMKKDTKISTPKSQTEPFALRKKEVPHEMALHKALENKPSIDETIQMIYSYIRDFSETLKNKEFKNSLVKRLEDVLNAEDIQPSRKLQILFFLSDLGIDQTKAIEEILRSEDVNNLIKNISILTFKKRVLQLCMEVKKDWDEIFLTQLFEIEGGMLKDFIIQTLEKEKKQDKLKTKLQELLLHPTKNSDVFLWYFQKVNQKKSTLPYSDVEGKNRFFENLLIVLNYVEKNPEMRESAKKIVSMLTAKRYELVRTIMAHASISDVKEYLLLSTKCESLSDHDVKIFYSLAQVAHPSIETKKGEEEKEEQPLWTTEEGYERLKHRIEHIGTVETIQNAREIEAARELGDLRENAEYKAALERRSRLQSELKLLSAQLNKSRILTPQDILENEVGPGSVVICSDGAGKTSTFTLLGPFDADPDKNILSFQSKLAQQMIGKKAGEKFTFQTEEYTINKISNFFAVKS